MTGSTTSVSDKYQNRSVGSLPNGRAGIGPTAVSADFSGFPINNQFGEMVVVTVINIFASDSIADFILGNQLFHFFSGERTGVHNH